MHIEIPIARVFDDERIQLREVDQLTKREKEVLKGLCERKSNKVIADELNIAERTVKFHVSKLMAKASALNRWDVVIRFSNIEPSGEVHA